MLACGMSPAAARDLCDPVFISSRQELEQEANYFRWVRGEYTSEERRHMGLD